MALLWLLLVLVVGGLFSLALYVLPSVIGMVRRVPNLASLVVVNVLLGWTVVGWAVALAMAVRDRSPEAAPRPRSAPAVDGTGLDTAEFETAELRLAAAELPDDPFRSL